MDMSQVHSTTVARTFAAIAPRYDLMNRLMTFCLDLGWRRRACDLLDGASGPGAILDVGTGTCDLSIMLARRYPHARIVGLDFSAEMLALGECKVARQGLTGRVTLVRGDALALPFPDASFTAVVSAFTVRNLANVPLALREMRRVVVPGGQVLCLELSRAQVSGFRPLFRLYFNWLVPILGAVVAGHRLAYTYLPASVEAFLAPAALTEAMARAGLGEVYAERLALGAAWIHVGRRHFDGGVAPHPSIRAGRQLQ